MNTRFPVILEEEVVCFSFFPVLLFWSVTSGVLIGIAFVLRDGLIFEAVAGGTFFAIVFAIISHIAYSREWISDWPTLIMRLVVVVVVGVVATLVKWLVYDDPHLLSYAITYLVLVSWFMFVTGNAQDRLAKWYYTIMHIDMKDC